MVSFVWYVDSLQGQRSESDQQGQCVIRHSVDALVFVDPNPADGVAAWGDAPDHHVAALVHLLPQGSDLIGVGDVDRPVATVGIEVCPVGGLNSEGRHVVLFVVCIVEPRAISRDR